MKTILLPEKEKWDELCRRPEINRDDLDNIVSEILNNVKSNGDQAIYYYSKKFDGVTLADLKVDKSEILRSGDYLPDKLKDALHTAKENLIKFHSAQVKVENVIETSKGVRCWRKNIPIQKVGLYIPGGSAPLFSTLLMLGIPAKIAGCKEIIVCTPSGKDGNINPAILYTANLIGINDIYKVGGAQAIAAMAFGTDSIPKVYKIFGPGNQYVTKAKELVTLRGVAIDMPAGPSEVLIIADSEANPSFVAADLLSQAEHGPDSHVLMLTDDRDLLYKVKSEIESQLETLPRKNIASNSLENSQLIYLSTLDECIELSNLYAPEHLILNVSGARAMADGVVNAGSVFIGNYSCESAGDYASGTNHTLPTNGYARNHSGVSVESFIRKVTFQEIDSAGIEILGPVIETMAEAESLTAHKNAVSIRLKSFENG